MRETYPQEKVFQKPPKPIKKNYSTEHLRIPKYNTNTHRTIPYDMQQYERNNCIRQHSNQESKNKVVENCQFLKLDSFRPGSSAQKESLNNSKYSNSSQKGQQYLDRRHFETLERINKLRIEKLKNEELELKDKPSISRNSQKICEKLRNQGNLLDNDKGKTEHFCRNIDNTINNMKKELYDTFENDRDIVKPNQKTKNKVNNYNMDYDYNKVKNDYRQENSCYNQNINTNETKVNKTNYTR